jgi:hypothetical protein
MSCFDVIIMKRSHHQSAAVYKRLQRSTVRLANGLAGLFCGWRGERGAPPRGTKGTHWGMGVVSTVELFARTGPAALVFFFLFWKGSLRCRLKMIGPADLSTSGPSSNGRAPNISPTYPEPAETGSFPVRFQRSSVQAQLPTERAFRP